MNIVKKHYLHQVGGNNYLSHVPVIIWLIKGLNW